MLNHNKNKINRKLEFNEFIKHIIMNNKLDDLNTSDWIDDMYFINFEEIKYNKNNLDQISTDTYYECSDELKRHDKSCELVDNKINNFYISSYELQDQMSSLKLIPVMSFILSLFYYLTAGIDLVIIQLIVFSIVFTVMLLYLMYLVIKNIKNNIDVKKILDTLD
jgi:hypothetical protein